VPSLGVGGAELFVKRLISSFNGELFFVLVVLNEVNNQISFESIRNVRIIRLRLNEGLLLSRLVIGIFRIRKIIKKLKPRAIQSFLYPADLFSIFLPMRERTFWSIRGTGNPLERSYLKQFFMKLQSKLANFYPIKIIACSQASYQWGIEQGIKKRKMIVINNFLDDWTNSFRSSSKLLTQTWLEEPFHLRIGLAARRDPHKGHIELIESVFLFVIETGGSATVSLIGSGTETLNVPSHILSSFEYLDKKFQVELIGSLSNDEEKAEWFSGLDIYVLASTRLEGFPNALYEAVAIGCPCVSTPSGNVNEFLNEKYIGNDSSIKSLVHLLKLITSQEPGSLTDEVRESQVKLINKTNKEEISSSYFNLWCIQNY
jgi:glycosyltransferase involved in cell wall biosynthesis